MSLRAFDRVLQGAGKELPPDFARYLLGLTFSPADRQLYESLSEKAQLGTLTPEEHVELDDLLMTNDLLTILQSKASVALR